MIIEQQTIIATLINWEDNDGNSMNNGLNPTKEKIKVNNNLGDPNIFKNHLSDSTPFIPSATI